MKIRQPMYRVHMIRGRQFLRLYDQRVPFVWPDYEVSSDFVFDLYCIGFFDPPRRDEDSLTTKH